MQLDLWRKCKCGNPTSTQMNRCRVCDNKYQRELRKRHARPVESIEREYLPAVSHATLQRLSGNKLTNALTSIINGRVAYLGIR